ncbi:MAG: hypothetical protein KGI29_03920 [Pseudomonadota bacterium]|nr:hypothetical protein [Pseudomonadota bacterium]
MSHDAINSWVEKAMQSEDTAGDAARAPNGVQVIRRVQPSNKGKIIMEVAEKIWPSFMKLFAGVRDENDMVLQPAHVRGIALNVAQELVNKHQDAA